MSSSYSSQQSFSSQRDVDRSLKLALSKCPPPYQNLMCVCGYRLQLKTSFTERNPCRRFTRCGNDICGHFTWVDEEEVPAYSKDSINLLICKNGELATEYVRLKAKYELDSSSSSRMRLGDECVRCIDLEILLDKMEKKTVVRNYSWFVAGIMYGFMLSILFVIISK